MLSAVDWHRKGHFGSRRIFTTSALTGRRVDLGPASGQRTVSAATAEIGGGRSPLGPLGIAASLLLPVSIISMQGRAMTCRDILPACFDSGCRFASSVEARLWALEYLQCHLKALDVWLEVRQEIPDYLRLRNMPEPQIEQEITRAQRFLAAWLP
jgi:hypothetical protein